MQHKPVLLTECLEGLAVKPQGIYVDATFGRGGHATAILAQLGQAGRLYAIDKDHEAIAYAQQTIQDERFHIQQGSFVMLEQWIASLNLIGKIDGILLDLGVSSPQLDAADRGFSFLRDGPLDMRMNTQNGQTAEEWINKASEESMAYVFKEYGEERFSRRIARAIVAARAQQPITSTLQLADIIKVNHPKWEKHKHPATRCFQAIRIFINQELSELPDCLAQCMTVLKQGGRIVVISFHSLEDRIVKRFFRQAVLGSDQGAKLPKNIPIQYVCHQPTLKIISKAHKPSSEEVHENPRARSAVLRIAEKLA